MKPPITKHTITRTDCAASQRCPYRKSNPNELVMGSTKEWNGLDAPQRGLLPLAWRYVSKRMSPEEEAAWRQAERRGQGDEWLKQRHRVRRKTQT